MSLRSPVIVLSLLLLTMAACSPSETAAPPGDGTAVPSQVARVEPEQVAERLLTQLRDEDYGSAYETLSTGLARDFAANELDLGTKLMDADKLVRDWSLEEPRYFSEDEMSKVEVTGTVTFDDDGSGRVRIVMQAIGMLADPWRIHEFELTRA